VIDCPANVARGTTKLLRPIAGLAILFSVLTLSTAKSEAAGPTPGPFVGINLEVADGTRFGDHLSVVTGSEVAWHIVVTNTGTDPLTVAGIVDSADNLVDTTSCVRSDGSLEATPIHSTVTMTCDVPFTAVAGGGSEMMTVYASVYSSGGDAVPRTRSLLPGRSFGGGGGGLGFMRVAPKLMPQTPPGSIIASDSSDYDAAPSASVSVNARVRQGNVTGDGITVQPGQATTWMIEVTNTGIDYLSDVALVDDLSVPVDLTNCSRSDGTAAAEPLQSGITMTCAIAFTSVAGGEARTFTANARTSFVVIPYGGGGGVYYGKVTARWLAAPSTTVSASDATSYLTAGPAAISINMRVGNGINIGDNLVVDIGDQLTWVADVANTGEDTLSNLVLFDQSNQFVDMAMCVRSDGAAATAPLLPGGTLRCATSFTAIAGGETRTMTASAQTSVVIDSGGGFGRMKETITVRRTSSSLSPWAFAMVEATDITSYTARSSSITTPPTTATPGTSSIESRVWFDTNGNDVVDGSERGISDVVLHLFVNGVEIAQTTSDSNGMYRFNGLSAGSYRVEFRMPANYAPTVGSDRATSLGLGVAGTLVSLNVVLSADQGTADISLGVASGTPVDTPTTTSTTGPALAPARPTQGLPATGTNVQDVLAGATLFLFTGLVLATIGRRRRPNSEGSSSLRVE
jgi:SdrD B-like domain